MNNHLPDPLEQNIEETKKPHKNSNIFLGIFIGIALLTTISLSIYARNTYGLLASVTMPDIAAINDSNQGSGRLSELSTAVLRTLKG
ncbi:MAG TPA: hypothetical protein VLB02_02570, partial [Candidatus Paceibacterota bacterium]|nr:hypothetical protein [Candidatus Paceibacterota bacterium]